MTHYPIYLEIRDDQGVEYYRDEILAWLDRYVEGEPPLFIPADRWHYYADGLVGLHLFSSEPLHGDCLLSDLSADYPHLLFEMDLCYSDPILAYQDGASLLRYQDGACALRAPSIALRQMQRSFNLFAVENDFYRFHHLDLTRWTPGAGPLFYKNIIKLVRGRDRAEELRSDLTRSGLAQTTIMTCYGPSRYADCGARDCLITFDSPVPSEEVMARVRPLYRGLAWENVSSLPYHHWDVEWAWSGNGLPPEGFDPTGTAWEHPGS